MTRHLILAQLKKEIDLILSFQKRVTKPARKTRLLILLTDLSQLGTSESVKCF